MRGEHARIAAVSNSSRLAWESCCRHSQRACLAGGVPEESRASFRVGVEGAFFSFFGSRLLLLGVLLGLDDLGWARHRPDLPDVMTVCGEPARSAS